MLRIPEGYIADSNGNIRTPIESKIEDGKIKISYHYLLEEDMITLRGTHPKLSPPTMCNCLNRLSCDYGEGFERCEFMNYVNGVWVCTYKRI